MAELSPWIIETSVESFERDVIERSREVPVVVDFWAAWCQPCRMLGPLLEKLASELGGRFVLVKVDTDRMPEVAAVFGVHSIPAVFAFRNGQVVDEFVGVMPEGELRKWLERLVPERGADVAAEARRLEAVDPAAAEARYRQALERSPDDSSLRLGLARVLLAQGRLDETQQLLDQLAKAGPLDAEGQRLQAELAMRRGAAAAGDIDEVRRAAEAAPDDLSLQLKLARSLAAEKQYTEAMDICLKLVEKDRQGTGEEARALMVQIFHLLGPNDPLVNEYRRQLAMLLF